MDYAIPIALLPDRQAARPGRSSTLPDPAGTGPEGVLEGAGPSGEMQMPGAAARIAHDRTRAAISELDDIDALVKTYRARLLRFVTFSTGDPDLAETITQDCLLKAYNARANFRGDSSVNTWLTTIAVNLIRDHQRTRKFKFWRQAKATALDVDDVASFLPSHQTTQEHQLLAKEQVARLSSVLDTLSFNQRSVFLMKFSDEMELQEISNAMNMPINTVKTHLHRALKAVRSQLGARP
jgi:RNA polymerase sigma-70 factor (ECF subfamily)